MRLPRDVSGDGVGERENRLDLRRDSGTIEERSAERRRRMVGNRATSHEDAERWDLDFWQSLTPEERLSVLVSIRRDMQAVRAGRTCRTDDGEEP